MKHGTHRRNKIKATNSLYWWK